jgi:predicted transcriptional regulator
METIELSPDLLETLEQNAATNSRSVSDLVNEAVERYLREQRRIRLQQEIEAYRAMHAELVKKHLDKWVAVYEGKIVDHDADGSTLHHRMREKYGHAAVLIRQVQEQAEPEIHWRTWSTGKIE